MSDIQDLNILQNEAIDGGQFRDVRLFAETTIKDALSCETLNVYEKATFHGPVKAKKIKVTDQAVFHGPVMALEIEIEGTATFLGPVKCNHFKVKNQITAYEKVEAYESEFFGMATFKEFDGFKLTNHGYLRSDERLRCNHITFTQSGRGKLHEVFSAIVKIASENVLKDGNPRVTIHQLVAYDVTLKHTHIGRLEAKVINKDEETTIHDLRVIGLNNGT